MHMKMKNKQISKPALPLHEENQEVERKGDLQSATCLEGCTKGLNCDGRNCFLIVCEFASDGCDYKCRYRKKCDIEKT